MRKPKAKSTPKPSPGDLDSGLEQAYRQLEYPIYNAKMWGSLAKRLADDDFDEENAAHIARVIDRLVELLDALYDQYHRLQSEARQAATQTDGRAA
jgi:hypothetical protein